MAKVEGVDGGARRRLGYSPETHKRIAGNSTLNDILLFPGLIGVKLSVKPRKQSDFYRTPLNPPSLPLQVNSGGGGFFFLLTYSYP